MKKSRKVSTRESAALPDGLEKRLSVYALTATVAGVGLLGAAAPAQASIETFTPNPSYQIGPSGFQSFSSAGIPLLGFSEFTTNGDHILLAGTAGLSNPYVMLEPGVGNGGSIIMLGAGSSIGGSGNFKQYGFLAGANSKGVFGPWSTGVPGYVGLSFFNSSNGNTYFGWAKLSLSESASGAIVGKLDEVAVDFVPGQSIRAGQTTAVPEPGTLSLLALGAVGLLALRKKRLAAVKREPAANG